MSISRRFFALLLVVATTSLSLAWVTEGPGWVWPHGTTLSMQKDFGAKANLPGATWNTLADNAIAEWNTTMAQLQLTSTVGAVTVGQEQDDINQMFFANSVYGEAFGAGTVGVAIFWGTGTYIVEGDIVFNNATTWTTGLFQTVALHELGHVLGLGHPDEDGQTVSAVMNSIVSIDHLSADDIAGIQSLYGAPAVVPVAVAITTQPVPLSVAVGGTAAFTVAATGVPTPTFQWRKNTVAIAGATGPTLTFSPVQASDAANYSVTVSNSGGSLTSVSVALTVTGVVTIDTPPSPQTVTVGDTATFSVSASGSPAPNSWQWKKNGTTIGGATASTLTLANVQSSAAGNYSVTVSNGIDTVTSAAATLTVNLPAAAPAITSHPSNVTTGIGTSASFSVTASGTPTPTYQWYHDGSAIAGARTADLLLSNVQDGNAGNYHAVATNSAGAATSNTATLTIATYAPIITAQPTAQNGDIGGAATFSVTANGAPLPTYQWQKNGTNLAGATSAILSLPSIQLSDAGNYRVIVTNSAGSSTSDAVALTVKTYAPTISAQPVAQTVTAGGTATFTITASGSPLPTYQWQKDGVAIAGATAATLALPNVQTSTAGDYRVVVTNAAGSVTSDSAVLTVRIAPSITTQPLSQSANLGATVTFTVVASGTPTPTYQWQKNASDIPGAISATLSLPKIQASAAGNYRVKVANTLGSTTSATAVLSLNIAPSILNQPVAQAVTVGQYAEFSVLATGRPTPTYQWQKDAADILGATGTTLALPNPQLSAAGLYRVIVTNTAGSVTSDAVALTVNALTTAPTITKQPSAQTVMAGSTATFSVTATGAPAPTYQWQKNRVAIANATAPILTLTNAQSGAAGNYRVVVTNSAGSITSSEASLTLTMPPSITTQPSDASVLVGASVGFELVATGSPAPTYQWFLNGQTAAGQTAASFLPFIAASYHNGATFYCVVTNSTGTATSRTATLTVETPAAPIITTQPADIVGAIGTEASFAVTATGIPAPTYQWRINGTNVPGQTGATFPAFTIAGYHDGWTFDCVLTNPSGSVTSRAATLSVGTVVPPTVTTQPQPLAGVAGQPGSIVVTAAGASGYRWFKGGVAVPGATGATLAFPALGSADAGIYDCAVTGAGGDTRSDPVVVGVAPVAGERTAGAVATYLLNIQHPKGQVYDQFLLNGAAGTFTAAPDKIARCSYLDEDNSIIQVEMSGAGAITVVLANASGPMAPGLYNQSGIEYMKGKATIILSGANETTHFSIYSVGSFTNPGVTRPEVIYAGWANVAAAGIVSPTGGLGGIHQGNVAYNSSTGLTGIYAPTVTAVGGLVVVHDIAASANATPYLYFGPTAQVQVKIAGGGLAQPNADSITVSGLSQVTMGAGQDSCGRAAPAQAIQTRLVEDNGTDVTLSVVTGP